MSLVRTSADAAGSRSLPSISLVLVVVGAVTGFILCCLFGPGGLLTSWHAADVSYYGQLGAHMRSGEIPYRTLYVEYPPGALPVFLAPAVSEPNYFELFKILMMVFGVATLAAVTAAARSFGATVLQVAVALAPLAAAPVLLGSVFLNRFDPWPMLLTALALAALLRGRPVHSAVSIGLAVAAKIYALAVVPVMIIRIVRTHARPVVRRAVVAFVAVVAVLVVPFVLVGPGGLAYSFYVQLTRHLEIESLGGSVLLAADRVGVYHAHIVNGEPGSRDLAGALPTSIGVLSSVVELAAILLPAAWYIARSESRRRMLAAFAAALTGYVAFGKVLSPQYLVWLLPVVPLALGYTTVVVFVAALALTNLAFHDWNSINAIGSAVWVLLARNLVLVGLYALLALRVRRAA